MSRKQFLLGLTFLLAPAAVFAAGAWVNAFAVFVLLPVIAGILVVLFFRGRPRCEQPVRWPVLLAGNALILAFLLSLLCLAAESYYRFAYDRTDGMAMTRVAHAWSARHFHLNSSGLRDNIEYPAALTPGRSRVTFVGDSFTAGYGLKDVDDRFANRIRRLHPEWEIHVAAKLGLDTSTEVDLMHNLTVSNHYQLDQVVLVYQINDIGEVMPGWIAGYKRMMAAEFRKSWLCKNSYAVDLFYNRWQLQHEAYMQKYFDELQAAYQGPLWDVEKFGLVAFQNLTRVRGGRQLLVVTFPFMDTALRFKPAHDRLNQYWQEQGIPHLDLLPIFSNLPPAKLMVNPHDAHPNEYAHALAAEAIDQFLTRQIPSGARRDAKAPSAGATHSSGR